MDLLKKVHETLDKGGKVLIPVFALGRAQELCILLESFWDRMNLKAPIYFSTGLTEKANHYYKLFIPWTNQKIRGTFVERNMFDFKYIKPFDRSYAELPGPMVVFATPGMLHAGLSLTLFKRWAGDERNTIIMPGYCVAGTVGYKVLSGQKRIELDNRNVIDVKLSVQYMSFSAHADASGIMQLIRHCEARNVLLVHGEADKMDFLAQKIRSEFNMDCFKPANGEIQVINVKPTIELSAPTELLPNNTVMDILTDPSYRKLYQLRPHNESRFHGVALLQPDRLAILDRKDMQQHISMKEHTLQLTQRLLLPGRLRVQALLIQLEQKIFEQFRGTVPKRSEPATLSVESVCLIIQEHSSGSDQPGHVATVAWSCLDDDIGTFVVDELLASIESTAA